MQSVCGGSKFVRLGDGQGFMEKFKNLISLLDFIATSFHCVRRNLSRFLPKLSFDKNLVENPKSFVFETISGFCSSLLGELILTYQFLKIHFIFSLE